MNTPHPILLMYEAEQLAAKRSFYWREAAHFSSVNCPAASHQKIKVKTTQIYFTMNAFWVFHGLHAAETLLLCGPRLFNRWSHAPGKKAQTGVGPIYQPLQSQQRAVGAAGVFTPQAFRKEQMEIPPKTTLTTMNWLSPGQKPCTFDVIKETVKVEGFFVF